MGNRMLSLLGAGCFLAFSGSVLAGGMMYVTSEEERDLDKTQTQSLSEDQAHTGNKNITVDHDKDFDTVDPTFGASERRAGDKDVDSPVYEVAPDVGASGTTASPTGINPQPESRTTNKVDDGAKSKGIGKPPVINHSGPTKENTDVTGPGATVDQ